MGPSLGEGSQALSSKKLSLTAKISLPTGKLRNSSHRGRGR